MNLQASPLRGLYLSLNPDHDRKRDEQLLHQDSPGEPFQLGDAGATSAGSPLQSASLTLARKSVRRVFEQAASRVLGDAALDQPKVQAIWTRSVTQSALGVRLGQLKQMDAELVALSVDLDGKHTGKDSKQPASAGACASAGVGALATSPAAKTQAWVDQLLALHAVPAVDAVGIALKAALRRRFDQLLEFTGKACPALCADNTLPQELLDAAACLVNDEHCPPAAALYRHVKPLQQARIIDFLSAQDKLHLAAS